MYCLYREPSVKLLQSKDNPVNNPKCHQCFMLINYSQPKDLIFLFQSKANTLLQSKEKVFTRCLEISIKMSMSVLLSVSIYQNIM